MAKATHLAIPSPSPFRIFSILVIALLILAITFTVFLLQQDPSRRFYSVFNTTLNDSRLTNHTAASNPPNLPLNASDTTSRSSAPPPDLCLLFGTDPSRSQLWLHNSRALCLTTSICLPNNISSTLYRLYTSRPPTTCSTRSASFLPQPDNLSPRLIDEFHNCSHFQRSKVTCAYGTGFGLNRPICPDEATLTGPDLLAADNRSVHWFEGLTILVPEYPYQRNIFHYSAILPHVMLVASHLDALIADWRREAAAQNTRLLLPDERMSPVVNIVFRGRLNSNGWQQGFYRVVFEQLVPTFGYETRVQFLGEREASDVSCVRNGVQLGFFGDINVWPFANDTRIAPDGRSIRAESVRVKEAVYQAAGVASVRMEGGQGSEVRFRVPPLVVGYARRLGKEDLSDTVGDNVKESSTVRVFTAEDEKWFGEMLREEVEGRGVELREFTTKNTESFEEQVRNVAGLGVVVGIHGANLVNAMFARPFGGLVEIFPFGEHSRCYYAGMNSGLAYWGFEAGDSAGGFRCNERVLECRLQYRNREVFLGAGGDREGVRRLVREAVDYLKSLNTWFRDGVPVELEESSQRYVIAHNETTTAAFSSMVGVWF